MDRGDTWAALAVPEGVNLVERGKIRVQVKEGVIEGSTIFLRGSIEAAGKAPGPL